MDRNPFEKDEGILSAEEALKLAFPDPERGTIIRWQDIEKVMGRSRFETSGWHIVGQFRKWLRRGHQIVTVAETSVGLRLLTDQEALVEVPRRRNTKAYRQMSRAANELRAVRGHVLSDHQRVVLGRQMASTDEQRKTFRRLKRGILTPPPEEESARMKAGKAREAEAHREPSRPVMEPK